MFILLKEVHHKKILKVKIKQMLYNLANNLKLIMKKDRNIFKK
jgi:hypothetical protein